MAINIVYHKTRKDGVVLMKTYSDENRYVVNEEGMSFISAIEPITHLNTYTEGDQIPDETE